MRKAIVGFAISLFLVDGAKAQIDPTKNCADPSCCNKYAALPSGVMLGEVHPKGETMLSYRSMITLMGGLLTGNTEASRNDVFNSYLFSTESMQMNMHMLMLMYGFSDRFTVMASTSINSNLMHMQSFTDGDEHSHGNTTEASAEHHMLASGLGDSKVNLTYALLNKTQHKLRLTAGLSLPTGSISVLGESDGMASYANKRLSYMMQLGSGTFDVLPALTYFNEKPKYTIGLQSAATLRIGNNKMAYRWGNDLSITSWWAYKWGHNWSSSVRAEVYASEQILGKDESLYEYNEPAANPNNYGGTRASVFLGTAFQPCCGKLKNWQLAAECGLPLYQYVNGTQSSVKVFAALNLNYTF